MGNVLSTVPTRAHATDHVTSESETMSNTSDSRDRDDDRSIDELFEDAREEGEARTKSKEDEMVEFKKELSIKREQRRQILARHRAEKLELEKSLDQERNMRLELNNTNKILREVLERHDIEIPTTVPPTIDNSDFAKAITEMREEFELLKSSNINLRADLANANLSLQNAYSDIADLHAQNIESNKHIGALKDVVAVSKTMVTLREQQLDELKNKLQEIEKSLSDREASMLSNDLRQEYERQLQNIRTLRGLYEERARLAEVTRQSLIREIDEQKMLYQTEVNKCKTLTTKVAELEDQVETLNDTVQNKSNQICVFQGESHGLRAEMSVVNKLFSDVLLGNKTKKDLDKLYHRLEENHGLLTQMAERENDSETLTALPKLLLEIVNQIEETDSRHESDHTQDNGSAEQETSQVDSIECPSASVTTTPEDIVENLPKVWRVLMELLSHQNVADPTTQTVTTCYKSVETKSGPVLVPSVSQTYIRLKDLIMEKLSLVKEVQRMKQLNTHLETRLGEQEKRLCLVTTELSKTWHVVGRLRKHHYQLHTHEKILKYELQQKRKLLNELKEELEYCKEKWDQAREKNLQSEKDLRKLRAEFSSRKIKSTSPTFNQSAESGYSDERPSDDSSESNDESGHIIKSKNKCSKNFKKSFETIFDSSTDFNLAAEGDDPVSDMIDVADLPLDTHEDSDNMQKHDTFCQENKDEGTNDSHVSVELQITPKEENTLIKVNSCHSYASSSNKDDDLITPERIPQSESFSRDEINDSLVQTSEKSEEIMDIDLNQPTCSTGELFHSNVSDCRNNVSSTNQDFDDQLEKSSSNKEEPKSTNLIVGSDRNVLTIQLKSNSDGKHQDESLAKKVHGTDTTNHHLDLQMNESSLNKEDINSENTFKDSDCNTLAIDFKSILENVRKQDDRLAKKDERLLALETGCADVVCSMNKVLKTGQMLEHKLHTLQRDQDPDTESQDGATQNDTPKDFITTTSDEAEASTSNQTDHEVRFAARDLRLKRLEEQTKSLVNKVNKTNSKGIKINYKLEELHSIYGSESSRAGTPSDDNEDKSQEDDSEGK